MKNILIILLLGLARVAAASEPLSSTDFYESRPGRVFQAEDEQVFQIGFLEGGGEVPILTWEGTVAGRPLEIQMQGATVTLISQGKSRKLNLKRARSLAREPHPGLDFNSARIFVASGQKDPHGVLCVEAFAPGIHRSTPFKEVYVILDPLGRAAVFQMPRRNASSLGLVRSSRGTYLVPESRVDQADPPNLEIRYHELTETGFSKAGPRVVGRYLPDDPFHFVILSEEPR